MLVPIREPRGRDLYSPDCRDEYRERRYCNILRLQESIHSFAKNDLHEGNVTSQGSNVFLRFQKRPQRIATGRSRRKHCNCWPISSSLLPKQIVLLVMLLDGFPVAPAIQPLSFLPARTRAGRSPLYNGDITLRDIIEQCYVTVT